MSERHEVPGGWVELRAPEDVPERLRQPLKVASLQLARYPAIRKQAELSAKQQPVPETLADEALAEMAAGGGELAFRMTNLNILARVREWSFGDVTLDALMELPARTFDELEGLCGTADDLAEDLGPNPDPQSPTPPSTV